MTHDLGYYYPSDGPMVLGEEYRWNVPVVTYGFDQSFLDYFGQAGVDAVEQAIQAVNDLPPASSIVLTNYEPVTVRINFVADSQHLLDVKSWTLSQLMQQLGLATPTRSLWTLKRWDPWWCDYGDWMPLQESMIPMDEFIPYYCDQRNYDPVTQQPSRDINGTSYTFMVQMMGTNCNEANILSFPIGPSAPRETALADGGLQIGQFYTGLTRDDVGGLLYLFSKTNINVETLDGTVAAAPDNTNVLVRTAARPGLEKITFVRQATNSAGNFVPMTNAFADVYFMNGTTVTQSVQRVTTQPDFVFSAKDLGFQYSPGYNLTPYVVFPAAQPIERTRWINNHDANGNPEGDGPGVISGPVHLIYSTPAKYTSAAGGVTNNTGYFWNWANFSASENITVFTGNQTNVPSLTLSIKPVLTNGIPELEWMVLGHQGATYQIDVSTNLINWTSATTITNTNGIFTFKHPLDQPGQYFRAVLKEEPAM